MDRMVCSAWSARWIALDADPRSDLGVFAFRNSFRIDSVPKSFVVRLSADQRYKLYVNGRMVSFGPQRGDVRHWFYETLDIAPFLREGVNWIAALVWNFGRWAPMAQHSAQTGFVFESNSHAKELTTPGTWQVAALTSWDFKMMHSSPGYFYIDVGPGEVLDGRDYPTGWEVGAEKFAVPWRKPFVVSEAEARGSGTGGTPWMLIPRSIPPMKYEVRPARPVVRRGFAGDDEAHSCGLAEGSRLELRPGGFTLKAGAKLLVDYGELLCAYPHFVFTGIGKTEVVITYAEGLWNIPETGKWWGEGGKGNRNDVKNKAMHGYQDRIILGEGTTTFEPLWWRTYRYLMIEVVALDLSAEVSGVALDSLEAIETGYPLNAESTFEASDAWVKPLWDVSLRTAQRCAGEHYFDCPYYEQLQYGGDTRIQTLIGYYLGRDRRLQRNAVESIGWSLMENGLTQSRYPSRQTQVIPPFSLWWVLMIYDQMMYDGGEFSGLSSHKEGVVDGVLSAYKDLIDEKQDGPFWQFADWVPRWRSGVPPLGAKSGVHGLTFALASIASHLIKQEFPDCFNRQSKAEIPRGHKDVASHYPGSYRIEKGLFLAEKETEENASEHAEALYRLCQELVGMQPDPWPAKELSNVNAVRCTYYFSYYKHLAMFARDDSPFDYLEELKPWGEMIENGLSTFAENPESTRSDCHAWSAHPILGFFQIVAGVTSNAPGWKRACIQPRPGSLKHFKARIAHPEGDLTVQYDGGSLAIDTPVPAKLIWKGKEQEIQPGKHRVAG